jgi:hypothetical protein
MDNKFPIIPLGVAETHWFLPIMKISQIEKWTGMVQSPWGQARTKKQKNHPNFSI